MASGSRSNIGGDKQGKSKRNRPSGIDAILKGEGSDDDVDPTPQIRTRRNVVRNMPVLRTDHQLQTVHGLERDAPLPHGGDGGLGGRGGSGSGSG